MFDKIIQPQLKSANEDTTDTILVLVNILKSVPAVSKETVEVAEAKLQELIKKLN